MKKTMFITSVIMVVVMAIALTTSSLAWFSASGDSNVTTNTLKLTAASHSTQGISISNDGNLWAQTIDLNKRESELRPNGNAQDLMPLVPYLKTSAASATAIIKAALGGHEDSYFTEANYSGSPYDTTGITDPAQAAALDAQYATRLAEQALGTGAGGATYPAYMIGAELGYNDQFNANVSRSGFMYDTFYIKNDATGYNSQNIKLNAEVSFKFYDSDAGTDVLYDATNRGGPRYSSDATLCVLVLIAKNQFDTTDDINTKIENENANPYESGWDQADTDNWEILVFAKSKLGADDDIENETEAERVYNITLGKQATDFDAGSPASECTTTFNMYNYMNNKVDSYDYLRPDREYDGKTIAADKKLIKVIAWYDGAGLNNNNSEVTDLKFDLRFTPVVTNVAWNATTADIYTTP